MAENLSCDDVPQKKRGFPSHEHHHLHRATNVANSPPQPLDVMDPSYGCKAGGVGIKMGYFRSRKACAVKIPANFDALGGSQI